MLRRLRRLLLLAIVALVAGAAVLFLTTRPRLDDRHAAVSKAWNELQVPVRARVAALAALDAKIVAAGPLRDPSKAVETALSRWHRGGDLGAQIAAMNDLEGAGRRLVAFVLDPTRRYHSIAGVITALTNYTTAALKTADVRTIDAAIDRYNSARRGQLFGLVADIVGDDALPSLVASSTR
jgi:hypothetical protein